MYESLLAFLNIPINKIFSLIFFIIFFFTYIKLSKYSSAKYYQDNKERLQRKARERYQSLSKEKKRKKSYNMVLKDTNISQKMKNKS